MESGMNKLKYTVCVHKGHTTDQLDLELKRSGGSATVPEREVEPFQERPKNPRMTDWFLTKQEAETLREDTRVKFVIPVNHTEPSYDGFDDKLQYGHFWAYDTHDNAVYPNNFGGLERDSAIQTVGDIRNAGLYLHSEKDWANIDPLHPLVDDNLAYAGENNDGVIDIDGEEFNIRDEQFASSYTIRGVNAHRWKYDGEGIDWVMIDSGIVAHHPEFFDENHQSRVQEIDWHQVTGIAGEMSPTAYKRDNDFHGTHVASTACGNKHGWAKKAHIYSCSYNDVGYNTDLSLAEKLTLAFDLVLAWHNQKTNNRPTVLNLSIGVRGQVNGTPWAYNFRDEYIPSKFQTGEVDVTKLYRNTVLRKTDGSLFLKGDDFDDLAEGQAPEEIDKYNDTLELAVWNRNQNDTKIRMSYNYAGHTDDNGDPVSVLKVSDFRARRTLWNEEIDGGNQSDPLNELMDQLHESGVHLITAAGNERYYTTVENPEDNVTNAHGGEETVGRDWNNYEEVLFYEDGQGYNTPFDGMVWGLDQDEFGNQPDVPNTLRRYYTSRPPAPYHPKALNVGSTAVTTWQSSQGYLSSRFSNFGPAVNIWALGENVVAAGNVDPNEEYSFDTTRDHRPYETDETRHPDKVGWTKITARGTSMAAPQVSGIACLYLQKYPNLTPDELFSLMIKEGAKNQKRYKGDMHWTRNDHEPNAITKENQYDLFCHYFTSGSVQFDSHASSLAVVAAPNSGTGSMTIENSSSYQDATKKLSICSSEVFNLATTELDETTDTVTLTIKDENGSVVPLTGLPIHLYVKEIDDTITEVEYTKVMVDNEDGTYTATLNNYDSNYVYIIQPCVQDTLFTPLTLGSASNITSPDVATASHLLGMFQVVYTPTADVEGTIFGLSDELDGSDFQYLPDTNEIKLINNPDIAVKETYSFKVTAEHPISGFVTSKTVTLTVEDNTSPEVTFTVNDLNSHIESQTIDGNTIDLVVKETCPINQTLVELTFSDFSAMTYSTVNVSNLGVGAFPSDINKFSIMLSNLLDFEAEGLIHTITIRATDQSGNSTDVTVNVYAADVDDTAPLMTSPTQGMDLLENETYGGATIYTVQSNEQNVSYYFFLGVNQVVTNNDLFTIDTNTGEIKFKFQSDGFDYETLLGGVYTHSIAIVDANQNISYNQVTHNIIDVWEGSLDWTMTSSHPDLLTFGNLSFLTLPEDTPADTLIMSFEFTSDEAGIPQANTTYNATFVEGYNPTISYRFEVVDDTKVNVYYMGGLDYEGEVSVNTNVFADFTADRDGFSQFSHGLSLNAGNVDDSAPIFGGTFVLDNVDRSALTFTPQVADDTTDIVSNPITYSIATASPAGWANVNSSTGVVTHNTNVNLDSYDTITVSIQATDDAGNSTVRSYTLNLASSSLQLCTVTSGGIYNSGYSSRWGKFLHYTGSITPQNCFISGDWDESYWISAYGGINSFEAGFTGSNSFSQSSIQSAFNTVTVYDSSGNNSITFNSTDASWNSYYHRMTWSVNSLGGYNNTIFADWRSQPTGTTFDVEWN